MSAQPAKRTPPRPSTTSRDRGGGRVAAPGFVRLDESGGAPGVAAAFVVALLALAALLFTGAAVSPRIVPWPRVALELGLHRTDLAVGGFAAVGIALALYFVQEVAP